MGALFCFFWLCGIIGWIVEKGIMYSCIRIAIFGAVLTVGYILGKLCEKYGENPNPPEEDNVIHNILFTVCLPVIIYFLIYGMVSVFPRTVMYIGQKATGTYGRPEFDSVYQKYELEQLKLDKSFSLQGVFFIGSGGIAGSDDFYYVFYVKKGNNINLVKVPHQHVQICYTEGVPTAEFLVTVMYGERNKDAFRLMREYRDYYWRLSIPKDSIVQDYNINIKGE